jgi:hypothetical protein
MFLFNNLTSLRLSANIYEAVNVINIFKNIGKIKFIAIEFPFFTNPILHEIDTELQAQINGLKFNAITLDCQLWPDDGSDYLDQWFLLAIERDANGLLVLGTSWPNLTEFILNDCKMGDIDLRYLAEFFPRLENLHINPKPCFSKRPVILTNDPFRTMNNMRVLKLDKVAVHSFEILDGGCMPNLHELYIRFADELDSLTRIESFPNFAKLAILKLHLTGVKWIDPKAFDHYEQLINFEIKCTQLQNDSFETGVAARFMSFHVACNLLKLTSTSVSQVEMIELFNYNDEKKTRLETNVLLSGVKRLTTSQWANEDLPFDQMTSLEYLKLETNDMSVMRRGQLKCLAKLKVLEVKNSENKASVGKHLF